MTKLNKLNDMTKSYQKSLEEFNKKGKITKEIIKLHPFASDGSVENIVQIFESFKYIESCPKNTSIASFLIIV